MLNIVAIDENSIKSFLIRQTMCDRWIVRPKVYFILLVFYVIDQLCLNILDPEQAVMHFDRLNSYAKY
jgi:hypothetical protein